MDASENFYRGWSDYKKGFGNIASNYWLGNDNIHALTADHNQKVKVEVQHQGKTIFADYDEFWIDDETKNYKLTVAEYTGTAGVFSDNFTLDHIIKHN